MANTTFLFEYVEIICNAIIYDQSNGIQFKYQNTKYYYDEYTKYPYFHC